MSETLPAITTLNNLTNVDVVSNTSTSIPGWSRKLHESQRLKIKLHTLSLTTIHLRYKVEQEITDGGHKQTILGTIGIEKIWRSSHACMCRP